MTTNARLVARLLRDAGIRHVFGVVGTSTLDIVDALTREDGIELVHARDEVNAVHMADGYARVSRTVGVCLVHVGPGALRAAYGVGTPYKDTSPVMLLTGNEVSSNLDDITYHVIDIAQVLRPITKRTFSLRPASDVRAEVTKALTTAASGRPGPVLLDVPKDVSKGAVRDDVADALAAGGRLLQHSGPISTPLQRPSVAADTLDGVVDLLADAAEPLLFVGAGIQWSGANEALAALAEQLELPVVTTDGGRGALSEGHRLHLGVVGRQAGDRTAVEALGRADVVLAIGLSGSDISTLEWTVLSPAARLVRVDIDAARLQEGYIPTFGVLSDAREFITRLAAETTSLRRTWKWNHEDLRAAFVDERASYLRPSSQDNGDGVDPWQVMAVLNEKLSDVGFVSIDSGMHSFYGKKLLITRDGSYIRSAGFGAMGYSFPALLGASLASGGQVGVAIVGDGCFTLCVDDLETAARLGLPVVAVVLNDGRFGSQFHHQQRRLGGNTIGTVFTQLDFAAIAEATGVKGITVSSNDEVEPAISAALAHGGPVVIDVRVDPEARPGQWIEGSGDARTKVTPPMS